MIYMVYSGATPLVFSRQAPVFLICTRTACVPSVSLCSALPVCLALFQVVEKLYVCVCVRTSTRVGVAWGQGCGEGEKNEEFLIRNLLKQTCFGFKQSLGNC